MKKYIILVLTALMLASCMTEGPIKNDFKSYTPEDIGDGWQITSPEAAGIDRSALDSIYRFVHNDESADFWMIRSLCVFRDGKLVAESYLRDESDRTTPRAFWSCTKQALGMVAGIAVDKGVIESVEDPISKYLPEYIEKYPEKGIITIEDLLRMRSGLDFRNYGINGDDSKILQQIPESFVEYSLAKDFVSQPGEEFKYKDSDPMILSAVIQETVGIPTDRWADEMLFSKIGFTNYEWIRYKSGITIGSFGILSTPREMAKIAQLALNGGQWGGEQVVSRQWVETMVSPLNDPGGDKNFGYLWWSYPQHGTYFMSGNGRQLIFVFPDKDLIVAITTEPNLQGDAMLSTPDGRKIAQGIHQACE